MRAETIKPGTVRKAAAAVLGFTLAAVTLYAAGISSVTEYVLRSGVLGLAGLTVLLLRPLAFRTPELRMLGWAIDLAIGLAFTGSMVWFLRLSEELWSGLYILTSVDLAFAAAGLLSLLELTRRAIGAPLAILAALMLGYALFGESLPWLFRHAGYSPSAVAQTVWYGLDGVFGLAAGVMVSLVFVYIVFGAVLESTGAGSVMLQTATRATDRLPGGAAHGAVVASALFGTISGSVTANVVGTGVFTMGLMKKRGFTPSFAGGVEASASAAGQFLPPVMGAAAFLMSELVGVSYLSICIAALLPALFFFASLFCGVRVEAARKGMRSEPSAERTGLTVQDMVLSLLFLVPIGTIILLLIMGRSPALAGFAAIAASILVAFALRPEVRRRPQMLLSGLAQGGIAGARIMVAVGTIGILIGVLNLTGLGTRIAEAILSLGDGSLFISLLLTMTVSIVLGMGLPTLPAYLLIVILVGPALQGLGVPLLAAHLFVMYFAVFSALTPPVALAAFAAAPIVNAAPTAIGLQAMKLSAVGFIIPFVFAYQPELLLLPGSNIGAVLWVGLRLALAIWLLSTALGRFDRVSLAPVDVLLRLAASIGAVTVWPVLQSGAVLLGIGLILLHYMRRPKETAF